ncbi:MAG: phosphate transport system regulatory protein PhoU [Phycisphaerales bacterium]|nr:MAG: phosphate transport system regulatory protein PhoU [Phycisphaerales bacterium]
MPTTAEGFTRRLAELGERLSDQGALVLQMVEGGFDHLFAPGQAALTAIQAAEDTVDKADVAIERLAVALLADATESAARLPEAQLRTVLTIVKVNNELERIADAALACATLAQRLSDGNADGQNAPPTTFRVLTNSVVGLVRDAINALSSGDARLARIVLQSDEAVEAFKETLVRDAEEKLRAGRLDAHAAVLLLEIATATHTIAEHAANIAEQLLYLHTGIIVRHVQGKWQEVPLDGPPAQGEAGPKAD